MTKEAEVFRKHEELMQVRDSLNQKITFKKGELDTLNIEMLAQKQYLTDITNALETKNAEYRSFQVKMEQESAQLTYQRRQLEDKAMLLN